MFTPSQHAGKMTDAWTLAVPQLGAVDVSGPAWAQDQNAWAESPTVFPPAIIRRSGGKAWTDDATGELVTYDEASARFPEIFGPNGTWDPPGMTQVFLTTPPELYPSFVAREAAAFAGVAVGAGALGLWVVGWRRPD